MTCPSGLRGRQSYSYATLAFLGAGGPSASPEREREARNTVSYYNADGSTRPVARSESLWSRS
jgi:hypothetical protein